MTAEILDIGLQAARIEKGKVVFVLMNDSCVFWLIRIMKIRNTVDKRNLFGKRK